METNHNEKQLLPIGTLLQHGKYRVEKHLASGGFGNTYIIVNTGFDRKFAMKEFFLQGINQRGKDSTTVTISNEVNGSTFLSQKNKFIKEAKRIIDLHNPYIVRVHDLFEENDTAYYVMDYVEGASLNHQMKSIQAPLAESEVRRLLPQMLDALSAAHQKGILHLDIKPNNIQMTAEGNIVLIDFGASKQIGIDGTENYSTSTAMCYTPGFAPSEQMDKRFEHLGAWTDIYALGATLYNLLTNETPPLISEISEEGAESFHFPVTVSQEMQQLIIWMMEVSRKKRPQTVEEVKARISSTAEPSETPTTANVTDTEKTRVVPDSVGVEKTVPVADERTVPIADERTVPIGAKEFQTPGVKNEQTAYREPLFMRIIGLLIAFLGFVKGIWAFGVDSMCNIAEYSIVFISTSLLVAAGLSIFLNKKTSTWLLVAATLFPNVYVFIGGVAGINEGWPFSIFCTLILFVVLLIKLIVLKARSNLIPVEGKQSFMQQIKNNNPVVLVAFFLFILFLFGWVWYNGFNINSLIRREFPISPIYYIFAMLSVAFQFLVLFILLSRVIISHQRSSWLLGGWFVIWAIHSYCLQIYIRAGFSDIDHMVPLIIASFMLLAILFLPKGVVSNWKAMRNDIIDDTAINMLMVYAVIGIITCFCFSLLYNQIFEMILSDLSW